MDIQAEYGKFKRSIKNLDKNSLEYQQLNQAYQQKLKEYQESDEYKLQMSNFELVRIIDLRKLTMKCTELIAKIDILTSLEAQQLAMMSFFFEYSQRGFSSTIRFYNYQRVDVIEFEPFANFWKYYKPYKADLRKLGVKVVKDMGFIAYIRKEDLIAYFPKLVEISNNIQTF